jgi:predicted nucleotidyltransferase
MTIEIAPSVSVSGEALAEICRRRHIRELSLFGSAARGEMGSDSDIDLLVEFSPEAKVGLLQHFAAQQELAAFFGRKVDLVSKPGMREPLRATVLPEARLLYAA